jgi:hypothetical protein
MTKKNIKPAKPWNDVDDERLLEQDRQSITMPIIALNMGRSQEECRARLAFLKSRSREPQNA